MDPPRAIRPRPRIRRKAPKPGGWLLASWNDQVRGRCPEPSTRSARYRRWRAQPGWPSAVVLNAECPVSAVCCDPS
jgi:hypothetical protein